MKRFKFSLQPLRLLLERQEQTALLQYAQAVATLEDVKRKLKTVSQELEAVCMLFQSSVSVHCPAVDLVHIQEYCQALRKEKKGREREAASAQDQVQLAFAKLVAARKASAVVNRYFEIQKRQDARTRQKHDQKFLDEISQRPAEGVLQVDFSAEPVWN